VTGNPVPDYGRLLSSERHSDPALMAELARLGKGSL